MVLPGKNNIGPDNLLRIETVEEAIRIDNNLPNAHLFQVELTPWELTKIVQFVQEGKASKHLLERKRKV